MTTISDLSFLNHQRENRKPRKLLPEALVSKWNSAAIEYTNRNNHAYPALSMFVDFKQCHTENLNQLIASDESKNYKTDGLNEMINSMYRFGKIEYPWYGISEQ